MAERAPERGTPAEEDRLNRNKDVPRTASFTASSGSPSPSSSCSTHTSSSSRCWMQRRDYKENANGFHDSLHGESLHFMRKLKAYQIKVGCKCLHTHTHTHNSLHTCISDTDTAMLVCLTINSLTYMHRPTNSVPCRHPHE